MHVQKHTRWTKYKAIYRYTCHTYIIKTCCDLKLLTNVHQTHYWLQGHFFVSLYRKPSERVSAKMPLHHGYIRSTGVNTKASAITSISFTSVRHTPEV